MHLDIRFKAMGILNSMDLFIATQCNAQTHSEHVTLWPVKNMDQNNI